jgi:hypothetical protein
MRMLAVTEKVTVDRVTNASGSWFTPADEENLDQSTLYEVLAP